MRKILHQNQLERSKKAFQYNDSFELTLKICAGEHDFVFLALAKSWLDFF